MNRPSLRNRAIAWAKAIRRDIGALWLAARDPRVPWHAKLVAGLVVAYAMSPVDLIPDFIPVIGYLDDIVIVPLGIMLAIRLIPRPIFVELRKKAAADRPPRSLSGLAMILSIWIAATATTWWLLR